MPLKKPLKDYKNILIVLPVELHRKFKVKLAKEDRTAKEFILTVIKLYAGQGENDKIKENGSKKIGKKS